jgi:hypothetical protein
MFGEGGMGNGHRGEGEPRAAGESDWMEKDQKKKEQHNERARKNTDQVGGSALLRIGGTIRLWQKRHCGENQENKVQAVQAA